MFIRISLSEEWRVLGEEVGQCGSREPHQEATAESRGRMAVT